MPDQDSEPQADKADATPSSDAGQGAPTPALEDGSPSSDDVSIAAAQADARAAAQADAGSAPDGTAPDASAPVPGAGADSTVIPTGAAPDTTPVPEGILSTMAAAGLGEFKTEAEAIESMKELRTKLSERDRLAQIGSAVLPHYDEFQSFLKDRGGAPTGQPAPEQKGWSPPHAFDPSWMGELQKEEADRNPVIMEKINSYAAHTNEKWAQWMFNPPQMVEELIMPAIEQRLNASRQEDQMRASVSNLLTENEALCTKYEAEMSQMMQEGVPLAMAIKYYQLVEKQAGGATPAPTAIPAAGAAPQVAPSIATAPDASSAAAAASGAAGIVQQTPAPDSKDSPEDIERWRDPKQAGRDALIATGHTPTPPGAI